MVTSIVGLEVGPDDGSDVAWDNDGSMEVAAVGTCDGDSLFDQVVGVDVPDAVNVVGADDTEVGADDTEVGPYVIEVGADDIEVGAVDTEVGPYVTEVGADVIGVGADDTEVGEADIEVGAGEKEKDDGPLVGTIAKLLGASVDTDDGADDGSNVEGYKLGSIVELMEGSIFEIS